jgi:hypothetical protein
MYVTDLAASSLEFRTRTHQIVQQVPELGLQEEAVEFLTVQQFGLEDVGVVLVFQLSGEEGTVTRPLEPHIPVDS